MSKCQNLAIRIDNNIFKYIQVNQHYSLLKYIFLYIKYIVTEKNQ